MVEDTMFSGESKNIEYKVSLPDKSDKYMKTIVAFANTQGGKLIVGVDDKTHQIVGVENDVLFQLMDGIANAVSDSCVPQIIPDIELQTVNGKTVIVVSVEAGKNRPYYLKSKGKDNGTYILQNTMCGIQGNRSCSVSGQERIYRINLYTNRRSSRFCIEKYSAWSNN